MKRIVFASLLTCFTLAAPAALAQTFPGTAAWVPITRDGAFVTDPLGDAQGNRDIVGDETHSAAYVYRNATHLFFRLRVDADPKQNATNYTPFGWGVALETDGNTDAYEYLSMLDGIANPDRVALLENTTQATKGNARDAAETELAIYPIDTHARSLEADTMFGDTPDFFVDWAIDIADLADAGLDLSTPIRMIFGTSNNAQTLASDLLAASDSSTISDIASDPINCSDGKCVACADLCGDACLKCEGATPVCEDGACVAGTSTACDSDADCTTAALPACQPGGTCGECSATNQERCGEAEMCDTASGECTPVTGGCKSDADCTDEATPVCGAAGTCQECSSTNTERCAKGQVCDATAGQCVDACDSDADCDDPATPACLASGSCGECSETNQATCDDQDLACHVPTGTCATACETDADCTDAAMPVCLETGVCGECSASNTDACSDSAPRCDTELARCVAGAPAEAAATFEGSGISCALAPARGVMAPLIVTLLGVLMFFRRRRR
jgi:hypothetical protein